MTRGSLEIREAVAADAAAIARVHVESSADAYAPLAAKWTPPDVAERARRWTKWLDQSSKDPRRAWLVAQLGPKIVGFIAAGPARATDAKAEVEVFVIHVLPQHRGEGIGGALWTAACRRVRGEALRSMYVETYAELRCCSFYEARGGDKVAEQPELYYGGAVTRVVYAWQAGQSSELPGEG